MGGSNEKILIIGKTPPPFGGVTVHVKRLIDYLKETELSFEHDDLSSIVLFLYRVLVRRYALFHLHIHNPYFLLFLVLIGRLRGIKTLITVHADVERGYILRKQKVLLLAAKKSSAVIALNEESRHLLEKYNKNTFSCTAFIPPLSHKTRKRTEKTVFQKFITYAPWRSFHPATGKEVYGIEALLQIFARHPHLSLTILDPSGEYAKTFGQQGQEGNVAFIKEREDILSMLMEHDVLIRNTVTDGDSLLVKEALWLGVQVIATDCVPRHPACVLVRCGDLADVEEKIVNVGKYARNLKNISLENGAELVISLYERLLNESDNRGE